MRDVNKIMTTFFRTTQPFQEMKRLSTKKEKSIFQVIPGDVRSIRKSGSLRNIYLQIKTINSLNQNFLMNVN